MNNYSIVKQEQLKLIEDNASINNRRPAKRVNIISLKVVKENSFLYPERNVKSPDDAYRILKKFLVEVDREYFVVLCLDTKNQPTAINVCHIGSLNASIVHPREVLKPAILSNSASIIVAHNHPSNDPTPSHEDVQVTKRLVEAGKIIGIEVLDHLVVCENQFISLKAKGFV